MSLWMLPRRMRFVRRWGKLYYHILVVVLATCAILTVLKAGKNALRAKRILPALGEKDHPNFLGRQTEGPRKSVERQISSKSEVSDLRNDEVTGLPHPARLPWFFANGSEWPRPLSKLSRVADVWPDPKAPHDDRIVAQLMYLPPGHGRRHRKTIELWHAAAAAEEMAFRDRRRQLHCQSRDVPNETVLKTILLEGSWSNIEDGQSQFLRDRCPVDSCRVYRTYKDVNEDGVAVDAIVFGEGYSGPSLDLKGNQVWVLHLLENPEHTGIIVDEGKGIDWIASYRMDSDIVTPYAKFVLYDPLVKSIKDGYNYAENKTKMVAWFVSNCATSNKRLEYAHKMQEHIQVDIYGACGPLSCPRSRSRDCNRMLERDYFFYLAFENANCRDYITEKFFNTLRHNVVPVVMGASRGEYRAAAPYHSYIHVEDFASPKELAEYLLLLSRNRTLYNEYFRWKGTGEFVNTYFWCRLCAMLHAPPRPHRRSSEDVYQWWNAGACRPVDR